MKRQKYSNDIRAINVRVFESKGRARKRENEYDRIYEHHSQTVIMNIFFFFSKHMYMFIFSSLRLFFSNFIRGIHLQFSNIIIIIIYIKQISIYIIPLPQERSTRTKKFKNSQSAFWEDWNDNVCLRACARVRASEWVKRLCCICISIWNK